MESNHSINQLISKATTILDEINNQDEVDGKVFDNLHQLISKIGNALKFIEEALQLKQLTK